MKSGNSPATSSQILQTSIMLILKPQDINVILSQLIFSISPNAVASRLTQPIRRNGGMPRMTSVTIQI